MSDKSTLSRAFNKHFFEFLEDIMRILPDDPELSKAVTSLETIKKMNPTILCKSWYAHVYAPYKEVIDKGDISFFFDKDYNSDLNGVSKADEIIALIDKIRNPIKKMDEHNKEHCSKYIQNLSKLAAMYSTM